MESTGISSKHDVKALIVSLIVAVALCPTLLAGCSSEAQETNAADDEAVVETAVVAEEETASPSATEANANETTASDLITADEALNIALTDASLSATDVTVMENKLDWENGVQVYDISFASGLSDFDYEINAVTGAIISSEVEGNDVDDFD